MQKRRQPRKLTAQLLLFESDFGLVEKEYTQSGFSVLLFPRCLKGEDSPTRLKQPLFKPITVAHGVFR
jgi:hypothetical protein